MEIAIIPVVTGLVQVIKAFNIPSKYAPAISVLLGVGISYLASIDGALLQGIVYGLSASGLYSGAKTIKK